MRADANEAFGVPPNMKQKASLSMKHQLRWYEALACARTEGVCDAFLSASHGRLK